MNIFKYNAENLKELYVECPFTHYRDSAVSIGRTFFITCACSVSPCGLYPARLLGPWDSPGENTGVGCRALHQGVFLTQESNPQLLHCRWFCHWATGKPFFITYLSIPVFSRQPISLKHVWTWTAGTTVLWGQPFYSPFHSRGTWNTEKSSSLFRWQSFYAVELGFELSLS